MTPPVKIPLSKPYWMRANDFPTDTRHHMSLVLQAVIFTQDAQRVNNSLSTSQHLAIAHSLLESLRLREAVQE